MPDAVIIGPQKAGTTWIHRYLESRGDICLPQGVKETMFFDKYFDRGDEWYASHFHPCSKYRRTVEVAPSYFHQSEIPKRIYGALGAIQLVCTLRNPAERSFSLYLHMRRYGMTKCNDFRDAVNAHPDILETSRYATHLERWIDIFGRDNVLVLFQHDLADNPGGFAMQLCKHLGISYKEPEDQLKSHRVNAAALPASPNVAAMGQKIADGFRSAGLYPVINWAKSIGLKSVFFGNSGGDIPSLSDVDRRWVIEGLEPEIVRLESILQQDLSHWRKH